MFIQYKFFSDVPDNGYLIIRCADCGHVAQKPIRPLVAMLGRGYRISDFASRSGCRCGRHSAEIDVGVPVFRQPSVEQTPKWIQHFRGEWGRD